MKRAIGVILGALAVVTALAMFLSFGSAIWLGDSRWGEMGALFFFVAIALAVPAADLLAAVPGNPETTDTETER